MRECISLQNRLEGRRSGDHDETRSDTHQTLPPNCVLRLGMRLVVVGVSAPAGVALLGFAGLFGLAVAAATTITAAEGKTGLENLLGRILRWRVGVRWYVIALGLPAVLALVILPGYLTNLEGRGIVGPDRKPLWPDTESLRWHRENVLRTQ